jgi:hypothetical protein
MKKAAVPSILVAVVLLAVAVIAEVQQPAKVYRIGYLSPSDPATDSTSSEAIRLALRELGYIEGQISPPGTDMRRGSAIGTLSLRRSWFVSGLISSWYQEGTR